MNQDENTLQGITEESAPEELQQTDATEEAPAAEAQSEELPEKFKGKSAAEIARAALEAEKRMHESTQESSSVRRQLQETQQRIAELQAQFQRNQQSEEIDPLEVIEKEWDEDPKKALIKGLRKQQETLAQRERRLALEMRSREGTEFYYKERTSNPDFAQREADMVEISRKYAHLINPEYSQSKDVMQALYLMARGAKLEEYEKAAVEKARKQNETIKEEKRKAVSERAGAASTSSSESVDMDAFASMSPRQMEEELERMARKIGRG